LRRIAYWGVAAALGVLALLPRGGAQVLAGWYARALARAVPRLRRTGLQNLRMAGFANPEAVADGVFRSLGRLILAVGMFPRIHRGNLEEWIRFEGLEHFDRAMARGKGVLFFTAHLGGWELSAFAHAFVRGPMDVVVRPLDDPLLDGLLERRRRLSGNRVIAKKDAARAILRALKEGRAVGILADQNVVRGEGEFVEFFGVPAATNTAFARLAFRSGAAVVPGFAVWEEAEGRYVLRYYPEVPMTGDALTDTKRLHALLEQVIREYPDQWLWVHRRWKTRPPGEAPLYD
jgi:KDO2-lipid IV(A) lauroyltransferase